MLFNSHEFLFLFLPAAFVLFWYGGWGSRSRWRLALLTLASYAFYSVWQFESVPDLLGSCLIHSPDDLLRWAWKWRFTLLMLLSSSVDYWAARWIVRTPASRMWRRRALLALSLSVNLGLLAFFKYAGFFTQIAHDLSRGLGVDVPIVELVLPVGISFYTFESMSYVIDIYRGLARPARSYLDYACFISFFPHLIAGPIIRYSDILHQFHDEAWSRPRPDWQQVNLGLVFLTIGLAKKLLVADVIAVRINPLWDSLGRGEVLGLAGSWAAVLGYTFRIYFDFSAYSDMAVGLGHLFAVRLPQNFNSPYKANDPIDFWRRWHITLSAWLRDYLYIPLGGNRRGGQGRNLMITMLLGGLWHGAAWLFIIWGAWHGLLLWMTHQLKRRGWMPSDEVRLIHWAKRQVTFLLIVVGWVFFRAADVPTPESGLASIAPAFRMFGELVGLHGVWPEAVAPFGPRSWALLAMCWSWCNFAPNSYEWVYGLRYNLPIRYAYAAGLVFALCILRLGAPVDFLYFRF